MPTMFAPPLIENTLVPLVLYPRPQNPEARKCYVMLLEDVRESRQSSPFWLESFKNVISFPRHKENIREDTIQLIRDIIRSSSVEEAELLESRLYKQLNGKESILIDVVVDSNELINVRAMAARLYVSKTGQAGAAIRDHNSALIRLGVLLGYADAEKWELVNEFINDPNPVVADEAKELLEDAKN
jgi:hypothetical protein